MPYSYLALLSTPYYVRLTPYGIIFVPFVK